MATYIKNAINKNSFNYTLNPEKNLLIGFY